jgi:hypothetical protein
MASGTCVMTGKICGEPECATDGCKRARLPNPMRSGWWKCGHCGIEHAPEVPFCAPCVLLATNPASLPRALPALPAVPPDPIIDFGPPTPSSGLPTVPEPTDARLQVHVTVVQLENRVVPSELDGDRVLRAALIFRSFRIVLRVLDQAVEVKRAEWTQEVAPTVPRPRVLPLLDRLARNASETTRLEMGVAEPEWNVLPFALPETIA